MQQQTGRAAPEPFKLPGIGNVGVLRGFLPFTMNAWKTYGDVYRLQLPGFKGVVLGNPEHIQHVLVSNRHNYHKGTIYDLLRNLLGDQLLTLEGDAWKQRRALMQPSFHRQSLERLSRSMLDSGARFFDALAARIGARGSVDMHHEMVRLTLDVVVNALFGRDLLEQSRVPYEALGRALGLLTERASAQLPEWVPTPANLRLKRTMRALDRQVLEIIQAARANPDDATLLSMLLATRDEEGRPLSDRELRNEVLILFIAGHETTALALTWMFALLGDAPQVLARMRSEVDSVLRGRDPTVADLPKLVYVRQVIDETLRARCPAILMPRNAIDDDIVGGFQVYAREAVLPHIWAAHYHPDFWPNPERFDPERFAPGAGKGRHPCAYIPFAAGARNCIGSAFSLMESTLLAAQLFSRFEVNIPSCAHVKPVAVATVRPSKPVRVQLSPRRHVRAFVPPPLSN